MKILGIETSCDETAVAVVEDGTTILSNVVASSKEFHEKTGGIIPEIAAREQLKCIIPVIEEALIQAAAGKQPAACSKIDAVAVTIGPGLIGSLLVGVETAKTITMVTGKPIIPVNHVFAHIYANFINSQQYAVSSKQQRNHNNQPPTANRLPPTFPAIALVASGGHTELFLMKGHGKLKWLGGTMDDAAGEAFDKTARMIGLGYGGGAAVAALAAKFHPSRHPEQSEGSRRKQENRRDSSGSALRMTRLPRPMMHDESLNFSFSGLKTAVMREIQKLQATKQWNDQAIKRLAYEIQEAITDVLVVKTLKAAEQHNVSSVMLGGGVAANQRLKEKIQLAVSDKQPTVNVHMPQSALCTDNAAVIASYAYFNNHPADWRTIEAQPNLSVEVG